MKLTDTHAHLYLKRFDEDRSKVIERAAQEGVTRILMPGITRETSLLAVQQADIHPNLFAAVGVHPTDALTWTMDTPDYLRELAQSPRVKAIGEIGLDYYWEAAPHDLQKEVLAAQLSLAAELNLPVVLHLREKDDALEGDCGADLLAMLEDWHTSLRSNTHPLAKNPGVLHSFSGSLEMAKKAIQLGFMIGVTGPLTYKKADLRREIVGSIPVENLLIETDAPYLSPHPMRGKRNEPAHVKFVAEKIAEIHHKTTGEIAEFSFANAARLFNW